MQDTLDDTVFAMSSVQPEHETEIAKALNQSAKQVDAQPESPYLQSAGRKVPELARAKSIQKTWPDLTRALGDRFEPLLLEYGASNPPRNIKGHQDGFEFACWLRSRGQFPSAARVEFAVAKVARGFPLRFAWLPDTCEAAVIYRLGGGINVGQVALPGRRRK